MAQYLSNIGTGLSAFLTRVEPEPGGPEEAASLAPIFRENRSAATVVRKPNSVPFDSPPSRLRRYGGSLRVTIIPLAPSLLTGSSGLPGSRGRVVRWALLPGPVLPYLALLRAGFCLPRLLPGARCALTAPFHPCLFAAGPRTGRARQRCVFCATFLRVAPTGCYPAHCPVEFGLSSPPDTSSSPLERGDDGYPQQRSSGRLQLPIIALLNCMS